MSKLVNATEYGWSVFLQIDPGNGRRVAPLIYWKGCMHMSSCWFYWLPASDWYPAVSERPSNPGQRSVRKDISFAVDLLWRRLLKNLDTVKLWAILGRLWIWKYYCTYQFVSIRANFITFAQLKNNEAQQKKRKTTVAITQRMLSSLSFHGESGCETVIFEYKILHEVSR